MKNKFLTVALLITVLCACTVISAAPTSIKDENDPPANLLAALLYGSITSTEYQPVTNIPLNGVSGQTVWDRYWDYNYYYRIGSGTDTYGNSWYLTASGTFDWV